MQNFPSLITKTGDLEIPLKVFYDIKNRRNVQFFSKDNTERIFGNITLNQKPELPDLKLTRLDFRNCQ